MKKRSILLLVVFCLNLGGCLPKLTPSIDYGNFSYGGRAIKNVKARFNKFYPFGASELGFCATNSQSHRIDSYSDLFGPVHIEWENAKGEKLTKDLMFTKEQLPSIKSRKPFLSSVYLYFTQSDVHLYTSDNPNIKQIREDFIKQAGLTCQEHRDREYIKKYGKKCLEQGCDDAISMYESMPQDSPLRKDPEFIEEYKKEKANRAKNNSSKKF
jgi:hypothetical protein